MATSHFIDHNKNRDHILVVNRLLKQPQIYIKINNVHPKALIDTGASISVINQNSLPNHCTMNTFQGKFLISQIH